MDDFLSLPHEEVLLQHGAWLRRLARALVRDPDEAEDVVQETWLAMLRARPDTSLPLRPWLARVLRNFVAQRRRGRVAQRARELEVADTRDAPSTDTLVARAEIGQRLVDAVLGLREPYRSILLLRYFEDMAPARIAEVRGLPPATVRSQLLRGLDALRERLDASHGDDRATWCAWVAPLAGLPVTGSGVSTFAVRHLSRSLFVGALVVSAAMVAATWMVLVRAGARGPTSELVDSTGAADPRSAGDGLGSLRVAANRRSAANDDGTSAASVESEVVALRLVDERGLALADYRIALDGGGATHVTSDATGFVFVPASWSHVVPEDTPGLGVDVYNKARRDTRAVERTPIELASSWSEPDEHGVRELRVPAGPTFRLKLRTPEGEPEVPASERLEARFVDQAGGGFFENGKTFLLAPVRRSLADPSSSWVRFGSWPEMTSARPAGVSARIEVRGTDGSWWGAQDVAGGLESADTPIEVELLRTGTVTGQLNGLDPATTDTVMLYVHRGEHRMQGSNPDLAALAGFLGFQADGPYTMHWLTPGVYTLHVSSLTCQPLSRTFEVAAGEHVLQDLVLVRRPVGGGLSGTIEVVGELTGKALVLLFDDSGAIQEVKSVPLAGTSPVTFTFEDLAVGAYRVDVVPLAALVPTRIGPEELRPPRSDVRIVLDGSAPRFDLEVLVRGAESAQVLSGFDFDLAIDGQGARTFAVMPTDAGEAGAWLVAGGMRWKRHAGPLRIPGIAEAGSLSWTVRAAGHAVRSGGRQELELVGPGLWRLVVDLRAL